MKRSFLLAVTVLGGLLLIHACSGDDGAIGVSGSSGADGSPQPMTVLLLGEDCGSVSPVAQIMADMSKWGGFALGSTLNYIVVTDSVPPLSVLRMYDALLLWTNCQPNYPDSLGNVLADYVDAGGAMAICTYATHTMYGVTGRIMTAGYSPFVLGPSSSTFTNPKQVDFGALATPLHKIFNGTDPSNLQYQSNSNNTDGTLDATATAIAVDLDGENGIAVSADGRIIGLAIWPRLQAGGGYTDALRLIGNALACAAGKF